MSQLPTMTSYAQNGEDVVLRRAFQDQSDPGFYIDIGACHPLLDSVTHHFYEQGWRGVNVEPNPELQALLQQARPRDANLQVAIGRVRGRVPYFPGQVRGHGSILADENGATENPWGTVPETVLPDVFDMYGPDVGEVAFLKVDVEGSEADVLASADWSRHRPRIVLVEAIDRHGAPSHEAWEAGLLAGGYRFAMFDGLNRFYCRDEDASLLLPRLGAPANVLDGWRRHSEAAAWAEVERLKAELDEAGKGWVERLSTAEAGAARRIAELEVAVLMEKNAMEKVLQERDAQIEALTVELTRARQAAAAALRREEEVEKLLAEQQTLSAAGSNKLVLNEEVSRLRAAHAALATQLDAILKSTSWRVTRPLRYVGRRVKGE